MTLSRTTLWASLAAFVITTATSSTASGAERGSEARWVVDYGSTKCLLVRHFGEAERSYRLEVERNWTFGGYGWGLYGTALPLYSATTTIEVARDKQTGTGRFKAESYASSDGNEKAIRWHDADGLFFDSLGGDGHIRVTGPRKLDVSITLSNLRAAIKAFETCENDLLASWGVDAAAFRSLSAKAEPSNYAGRWVTNDDYPRADLASKNEGMTTFLLTVGADGAATGCRIVGSSGFPSLDARACELLLSRAAFRPARNVAFEAVPSFYINKVRWQVPR